MTTDAEANYPTITKSDAIYQRAVGLIPATTQTLAKGPQGHIKGVAPKYLRRGKGGRVWDVDGNEYVDMTMGVGPLVLGYGYDRVDEAIRAQLADGITFSLMHPLEVEVAELMREVVPGAEMVRFSKSGCDVTSAAIRTARAYTGKNKVLCCGYHGWHDWYITVTDRDAGIPAFNKELTFTFQYNDLDTVLDAVSDDDDFAAVILEPVTFLPPKNDFLKRLRQLCSERGIVLIFDEMWTGFRLALGGAQEYFDVTADLATFSKAVANGMPISMLTGKKEIMSVLEQDVFFYTTFGGEALSLAAAKACIQELRARDVPAALRETGAKLRDGYNEIAAEHGLEYSKCIGFECRSVVTFQERNGQAPMLMKTLLQQEMIRNGVLWGGFHNVCYSHTQADVDHVLAAYRAAVPVLARAVAEGDIASRLRGEPLEPVFRRIANFHTKPKAAR